MTRRRIFQSTYPAIVLLLVAGASYFQAQGVTQLLSATLMSATPTRPGTPRASPPLPPTPKKVVRNVFDSTARPLDAAPSRPRTDFSDPLAWPVCDDVRAVLVTESSDPWWSLASLRDSSNPQARVRRVGDGAGGKRVAFIGFNPRQQAPAVWLEDGEAPCQAMLFRESVPASTPVAEPSSPGVEKLSDTERNVARSVVESTLADAPQLLRAVRVVPEMRDGRTVGLRLFGIRPGTLLASLGVRNGDRLESINGFEVANPEKALEAYARLRSAQQLRLRLTRACAPLELSLNII